MLSCQMAWRMCGIRLKGKNKTYCCGNRCCCGRYGYDMSTPSRDLHLYNLSLSIWNMLHHRSGKIVEIAFWHLKMVFSAKLVSYLYIFFLHNY